MYSEEIEKWSYVGGAFDPLNALIFAGTSSLKNDQYGFFNQDKKGSTRQHIKNVIFLTISNTANIARYLFERKVSYFQIKYACRTNGIVQHDSC
jgi:hypothetical protein